MNKEQYLRTIGAVVNSPRNNLQKIGMLQYSFKLYVAEHVEDKPVTRARWVVPDKNYPETCSLCGFEYVKEEDCGYLPKYCPECGTPMEAGVFHLYL